MIGRHWRVGPSDLPFEPAMRWSVEDGIRFGIDLSALIADNRSADDLIEMLTARIEDTLSIYGVGFDPLTVLRAMNRTFRLINSKRGRRLTARLGMSRDDLLSLLLGVWVSEFVNRSDEASNSAECPPNRRDTPLASVAPHCSSAHTYEHPKKQRRERAAYQTRKVSHEAEKLRTK